MTVMSSLEELLAAVHADQHHDGETVRPPATAAALSALVSESHDRLGMEVPEDYLAFLHVSDGLDYNGLVLYSAFDSSESANGGFWQGLVAANLLWRDDPDNAGLLILGDSDLDIFAWVPSDNQFAQMDRIGRDRRIAHRSCEAMIEAALTARL